MKPTALISMATALALVGCASTYDPPRSTSIDDLVRTYWKVPSYQFGKSGGIATTAPHDRLSFLSNRITDLSALCVYQNGAWKYLGPPLQPGVAHNGVSNSVPSAIASSLRAPATQQNLTATVQAAEQSVSRDVFAATMAAIRDIPDEETLAAISDAEKKRWLGRYQCVLPTQSWTAELRFSKPVRMSSEGVVYKRDVIIETLLTKSD